MVTNIIQIGNSKGIILPSEILKQLRLSLKSTVSVSLDGNNIVIKAQPRQGWAEAAKRAHENGDDELYIARPQFLFVTYLIISRYTII